MSHIHIQAARTPEKPAVVMAGSGLTLTFGELEDRSNQAAQAFRSLGVAQGDCVAVLLENKVELFELLFAAQRAGIYFTAVSGYGSAPGHIAAFAVLWSQADEGGKRNAA